MPAACITAHTVNSLLMLQTQRGNSSDRSKAWSMAYASNAAKDGDKLIDRIAFWSAFGMFAAPIMSRLADKLDSVTDRVERHMAAAA